MIKKTKKKSKKIKSIKIKNIKQFSKGKRGVISVGLLGKKKIAIKTTHPKSGSPNSINNEIEKLKILNKKKIGPKLIPKFSEKNKMVYEFIKGIFIKEFLEKSITNKQKAKKAIIEVLNQCFIMDKLGLVKEEMTNPYKHVIISDVGKNLKITLVDFERCKFTEKPHNVTQFCQYIMRNKNLLDKKGFNIDKKKIISTSKIYKKKQNKENFKKILRVCCN